MTPTRLIAICLLVPSFASGQVFKCVKNGQTVYSGSPCGANAQPVHAGEESAAEKQRLRDAAKDEGALYRYHQGLIDDARRRQKEAEDEHFSNCYGSNF